MGIPMSMLRVATERKLGAIDWWAVFGLASVGYRI